MSAPLPHADGAARAISRFFTERTGQRLGEGRMWRLDVALRPLQARFGLPDCQALARALAEDPESPLAASVIEALLNHETSFFRDPCLFETLEHVVLPAIHARKRDTDRRLRIWCAGAARGQEPLSIAMLLRRAASLWRGWQVSLLATDICPLSIEAARTGLYTQNEAQRGLPINELIRWFEPAGDDWLVSSDLRGMIEYRAENLLAPGLSVGRFDLVLCRNLLIYLDPQGRERAIATILARCHEESLLMLGAGETVQDRNWTPSLAFRGFYQRKDAPVAGREWNG